MTAKSIREIKFEKGERFTTKFILEFDREWSELTRTLKKSGINLNMPITQR